MTVPRPDPACLRRRSHWVELEAHEASVRRARRDVSASLGVWRVPEDLCADAELLTSELATNAVRHTLGATFLCQVTLMQDESVTIEVHDDAPRLDCHAQRPADLFEERGRGLFIVKEIAQSWGAAPSARTTGNVVWATLRAARTAVAPSLG